MNGRIPLLLLAPFLAHTAAAGAADIYEADDLRFRLAVVADNLEHPWSLAFLPDGSQLVTERAGRLRVIRDGELHKEPVTGVPQLVVAGQGGLLDVLLHPEFDDNQVLFLSYAHRSREGMTTRVARARFDGKALSDAEVIFEASPRGNTTRHFAGRMVCGQDGHLYISVGDRGEMERAQDTRDDAGGVHRITINGEPAPDNPFLSNSDINNTFFTYGNRNIQGMTLHPDTGEVWSHE
ncbi:PQQ-dependent sugar dehydrogenase, partial [uncultured Marinobacter sp.]|uniref:PQQ-dependent sugar dehydrogenase n=1 Tax=uncultured Marinobacter sp. TaxID=187379 RepID=UPI00258430F4